MERKSAFMSVGQRMKLDFRQVEETVPRRRLADIFAYRRRQSCIIRRESPGAILVASYNIHKCIGVDKRFDPDRTAEVIGEIGADVIALQEADRRFGSREGLLDLDRLQREHGLLPVPTARPSASRSKSHGWHGNLLLFREGSVHDVRQIRLPGVEPRGALVVDLELLAGPLRVISVHMGLLRRSRAQQAKAIMTAVANRPERPTVLLGDLNEWRLGNRSSLVNFGQTFGPLTAALPTFPAPFPLFALDRILASPSELVAGLATHDTPLARVASDHLPVKARIDLSEFQMLPSGARREALLEDVAA